jgi:hypothetical protein
VERLAQSRSAGVHRSDLRRHAWALPDRFLARRVLQQRGAISEARRAGVDLPPPRKGKAKTRTRKSAEYAYEAGQHERKTQRRPRVSRAVTKALKREPRSTVSRAALSQHASQAASRRTTSDRSEAARKAARTKGAAGRSAAARKAAQTRARRSK